MSAGYIRAWALFPGRFWHCRALALFLFLVAAPYRQAGAQTDKATLLKNKSELENEIRYTTQLLQETRKNKKTSLNQIVLLQKQIARREELINNINRQVQDLDSQIGSNNKALNKLTDDLKSLKAEYARMIYYAYKNRSAYDRLMFLFSAKDFNQAYQRLKYFQQYSSYRKKQAEMIRNTQNQINSKTHELEISKTDKTQLVSSKEQEKAQLVQVKDDHKKTFDQLKQKEKQLKKTLQEKEEAARKLQKAIEAIIAEEMRKSAGAEKTTVAKAATPTSMALTPEELELSNNFAQNQGRLPWPAERGVISGTFGEHPHPVLKGIKTKNNGIDILTTQGAAARAVFSGVVTAVMSVPSYNHVVILRHGNFLTVYSNLETVSVKKGDKVKIKQTLGTIFTDPEESRTELHFELWKDKIMLNPAEWIAGRK